MNRHCTTPAAILAAILTAASAAFGTNEYSGASDGDWFVDANWSLGRVPTAADDVEISSSSVNATGSIVAASITLSSATLRLGSETYSNVVTSATISGDLTLEGASKLYVFAGELPESEWSVFADNATAIAALYAAANTVTVGGAFTVDDTSVVYPAAALLTGVPVFFRVGTFSLAEGASFDAKKRGWGWSADAWANAPAYAKPRNKEGTLKADGWTFAIGSGLNYDVGGSYGGAGIGSPKTWQGRTYGATYGSIYAPFLPGSPAGAYQMDRDGQYSLKISRARGPGSVVVLASGAATVDGTIDASGVPHASGCIYDHSGASGGGIWLAAASFTFGANASLLASGENSAGNAYAPGGGGRIAIVVGIDPADYSDLLSGLLPDDAQMVSLDVAHTVAGGAKLNGTQALSGTATTVRGALADTDIVIRGAPVLAIGVSPAYGHHGYASGTTATLTAPAFGYDPDTPDVRYPCVGYVVSNATTEVDSGAGTQVEFVVGSDDLSVTWLWGAPQPRTVVRKPADGALRVTGETLAGDAVFWSLGDMPAVTVVPDAGYAFVCWEGNVPFGLAFDNPLSLSVDSPVDIVPVLRLDEAATTRTWSGTGVWTDATKWSPAGNIPGSGDTVVISSGTCFVSNALAAAALQVAGGTLSVGTAGDVNPFVSISGDAALSGGTMNLGFGPRMAGHARLAVGGGLALSDSAALNVFGGPVADAFTFATGCSFVDVGGALTLDGTSKLSLFSDYLTGGSVKVVADSVSVGATAKVEADLKGYMWLDTDTPPDAPGIGYDYSIGASHGGVGGGNGALPAYGQRLAPVQPGSPGGCYNNRYDYINRGGGLVRIHAARTMKVDGAVTANANTLGDFGGGSGGGVWLTASKFAFGENAVISARGGRSNYSSNGGGGRIALGRELAVSQVLELAATGSAAGVTDKHILDEAGFRNAFGNTTMTVDVGSVITEGKNVSHPGTFVFVDCKKRRTVLILN